MRNSTPSTARFATSDRRDLAGCNLSRQHRALPQNWLGFTDSRVVGPAATAAATRLPNSPAAAPRVAMIRVCATGGPFAPGGACDESQIAPYSTHACTTRERYDARLTGTALARNAADGR